VIELADALPYKLWEPNILVLDIADYSIDAEECGRAEILKIDKAVREKTGLAQRSGGMVQPWYRDKYFRVAALKTVCRLTLAFRFTIETMPRNIKLVCERPEAFEFSLNGERFAFVPEGTFIDNSFFSTAIDAARLRAGENILRLDCDFNDTVGLEALYLTGEFGVSVAEAKKTITVLPETLTCRRPMSEQGLPFYSGKVTLYTGVKNLPAVKAVFPEMKGAYYAVDFGSKTETAAFAPYETDWNELFGELSFTACFTRRNTFGPLHVTSPRQHAYGPFSFKTEGEDWTDNYTFYDERPVFPRLLTGRFIDAPDGKER
jgi:hypothetical protein